MDRVPKLCGADIELGNYVLGSSDAAPPHASRRRVRS